MGNRITVKNHYKGIEAAPILIPYLIDIAYGIIPPTDTIGTIDTSNPIISFLINSANKIDT